jgi:hypothetical protein
MAKKRLSQGIDVDRLDQLVNDLGVRVRLWKSTIVPSMTSLESYDQDLNDTASDNSMVDFDCQETIALFQQQNLVEQFQIQGTFHIDEIMVTFLSGVTLAPFAKIEVLDFEEDFYELVQRQEGTDIDNLKYAACSIVGLFTYDKTTKTTERYYENTDFKIDVNGNILWIGAHKPADRKIYSIYYKFHPIYRAVKAVHRDRFSQFNNKPHNIQAPKKTVGENTYVKMPETWIIKRDYLLKRDKNTLYDPNE